ncbi:hypothetical protein BH18ACT15_BH18ACT15_10480 [soil metagenome]
MVPSPRLVVRRRRLLGLVLACLWVLGLTPHAAARPGWQSQIVRLTAGHDIGVSVGDGLRVVLDQAGKKRRSPASNQKLLLTMALFAELGPAARLPTTAGAVHFRDGVVHGDLWLVGGGDPALAGRGGLERELPFPPTRLGRLAARVAEAGVERVTGRIMGSTGYFRHDWWAPGWESFFPAEVVALPSALTYEGNVRAGRMTTRPELLAARYLRRELERRGVWVSGRPGTGAAPGGLKPVARVRSQPLARLAVHMNRESDNFFAEVLGKRLGVAHRGAPGTIAKGAAALEAWARERGVTIEAHDSSGLSRLDHVSTNGLVRLLSREMRDSSWRPLRRSLAAGDQGTLEDRLQDVRVRAKTGSLFDVSALSGWVWSERGRGWIPFSIISRGVGQPAAIQLEDRVVRLLARRSPGPSPLIPLVARRLQLAVAAAPFDARTWLALARKSVAAGETRSAS